MSTKRKFTKELKQEACRLVLDQGQSRRQTARDLGINESVLGRWISQYKDHGVVSFPGSGKLMQLEEELRRLQRELRRVTEEREILKKAITYFREHEK